jgi:hypothetical protein
MGESRGPVEGVLRPLEPALPAVGDRKRGGALAVGDRERRDGAQPLALARRLLERPDERRERAASRPASDLLR